MNASRRTARKRNILLATQAGTKKFKPAQAARILRGCIAFLMQASGRDLSKQGKALGLFSGTRQPANKNTRFSYT